MRYQVVVGGNSDEISAIVNTLLKEGWKLQGGITLESQDGFKRFYQAMFIHEHQLEEKT